MNEMLITFWQQRNCFIWTKFCDFWLPPIAFQINTHTKNNRKKTKPIATPTHHAWLQSFFPFHFPSFYILDFGRNFRSQFRMSFYLDAYCLYHQSALVAFAFVIINDYWIWSERKKVNRPSLLTHCHDCHLQIDMEQIVSKKFRYSNENRL